MVRLTGVAFFIMDRDLGCVECLKRFKHIDGIKWIVPADVVYEGSSLCWEHFMTRFKDIRAQKRKKKKEEKKKRKRRY